MTNYYEILNTIANHEVFASEELHVFEGDDSPVGVIAQWEDGDICYVLYYAPDYDPNMGDVWVVEDFMDGSEQYEYATLPEAIHKLEEIRNRA